MLCVLKEVSYDKMSLSALEQVKKKKRKRERKCMKITDAGVIKRTTGC